MRVVVVHISSPNPPIIETVRVRVLYGCFKSLDSAEHPNASPHPNGCCRLPSPRELFQDNEMKREVSGRLFSLFFVQH